MLIKIILVDDSPEILSTLSEILVSQNYNVIQSSNGIEGLEAIRSNQDCQLIITDLNMPDISGLEMVSRLAEEGICLDVPKVILTTDFITKRENSNFMDKKGKKIGVRAWFLKSKDFFKEENVDHFLSIVREVLDGR